MRRWWTAGGISGLLFVIILIVVGAGIQGGAPVYDEGVDEIRAYWVDDGGSYLTGDYILGLAFFLLYIPYLVALRTLLGNAEGGSQICSRIAFVGGLMVIVLAATAAVSWTTLALAAEQLSDESIMLLSYVDLAAYNAASLPICLPGPDRRSCRHHLAGLDHRRIADRLRRASRRPGGLHLISWLSDMDPPDQRLHDREARGRAGCRGRRRRADAGRGLTCNLGTRRAQTTASPGVQTASLAHPGASPPAWAVATSSSHGSRFRQKGVGPG
jgi:hypothetical protein